MEGLREQLFSATKISTRSLLEQGCPAPALEGRAKATFQPAKTEVLVLMPAIIPQTAMVTWDYLNHPHDRDGLTLEAPNMSKNNLQNYLDNCYLLTFLEIVPKLRH